MRGSWLNDPRGSEDKCGDWPPEEYEPGWCPCGCPVDDRGICTGIPPCPWHEAQRLRIAAKVNP
jgi:hypothetical protein